MKFVTGNLDNQQVLALLQEHLDHMRSTSPPESTHALDIDALRASAITFWSAWEAGSLLGCVALKELDSASGEIKSMRTTAAHLRKGVAARMLDHVITTARHRHYEMLFLETGSMREFLPARKLYEQHGFTVTLPFGDYVEDPNSIFMKLQLNESRR